MHRKKRAKIVKDKLKNKEVQTEKKQSTAVTYPLIGVSMPLCILICYLTGRFLDNYFGTSPVLLIIFIFLGIIAGYMQIYNLIKKK